MVGKLALCLDLTFSRVETVILGGIFCALCQIDRGKDVTDSEICFFYYLLGVFHISGPRDHFSFRLEFWDIAGDNPGARYIYIFLIFYWGG